MVPEIAQITGTTLWLQAKVPNNLCLQAKRFQTTKVPGRVFFQRLIQVLSSLEV